MNFKKLSLAASISLGILISGNIAKAEENIQTDNNLQPIAQIAQAEDQTNQNNVSS